MEKLYNHGGKIGARKGATDSIKTRIRGGWNKFRDLLPLIASRGLLFEAKGRLCSACVCSIILYGSVV